MSALRTGIAMLVTFWAVAAVWSGVAALVDQAKNYRRPAQRAVLVILGLAAVATVSTSLCALAIWVYP